MKRWAILALLGLLATAALAADNATLITPCGTGCVTVRAKDIGLGVQSPVYILGDTSGNPIYGTAGTANANVLTVQGIAAMTALKVDGSGVTQPVSGTVTANAGTGTFTVGGTVTANQGGAPWSENITQFNGVALSTGTGASGTGIPRVTVANDSNVLATQSGTWTVQQGTPPWQQVGNVASAAADSGNPVKVGCVAHTALPTAGADGNRFDCMADKFGRLAVVMNGDRALASTGTVTLAATTAETTLLAAGGAGVFLDATHLSCTNNSATLVRIDIRDATAGTIRFSRALAASGGGFVDDFNMPFPQAAANNNWTVQLSASVTDVRCDILAMKNK